MVDWPVSLPATPLHAGYSLAPQPNTVAFGTEVGPGKVRRRTTARVQLVSGALNLTSAQLTTFVDFFENDLLDGALSFTWSNHATGGAAEYRFAPSNPYQVTPIGATLWRVAINLQIVP